ncbi:MAG: hypothetical protein AAF268_03360 [Cyanobacteria bacterium P01_A01_bin.3]
MIWVIAVVGIAIVFGCFVLAIACLPWRVSLRWRKTWDGPLAIQARIYSPGQWYTLACSRHSRIVQTLQHWLWPSGVNAPAIIQLRQVRRNVRILSALRPAMSVSVWVHETQFGFDDPSLTGECLGLLAAMPRSVQRSIAITFERAGCRSRGQLDVTIQPIAIGWRLVRERARRNGWFGNRHT